MLHTDIPVGARVRTLVTIRGEERGRGRLDIDAGSTGRVVDVSYVERVNATYVHVIVDGDDGQPTIYHRTEVEAL